MKKFKALIIAALALSMLTTLAACSKESADEPSSPNVSAPGVSDPSSPSTTPIATPEDLPEPVQPHYPVEIITYNYAGEEIVTVYEKAPERVLAVYQGSIETMIALGLEDRVIASYGLDNEVKDEWKDGFAKMSYDDSVFAPDKETVVMLEPDMIFSWGSYFAESKLGDVDYWIESGVNPYINSNTRAGGHPRTLENEYTDLINIGKIFDVEEMAQAIVDEMKNEIASALAATQGREKQTVAMIEFLGGTITNYTGAQLGGNMIEQLGGEMAIPDVNKIGTENLIDSDPDVIFVVYMQYSGEGDENAAETCVAEITENPVLASLSAVQNGRVYAVMLGDMYASTVRTIDGIRTFAAGLYPELYS